MTSDVINPSKPDMQKEAKIMEAQLAQPVEKVSPLYHVRRGFIVFLKYFSLVFITFWILLPLVSCVWTAAKTDAEYKTGNVMAMPHNWFSRTTPKHSSSRTWPSPSATASSFWCASAS